MAAPPAPLQFPPPGTCSRGPDQAGDGIERQIGSQVHLPHRGDGESRKEVLEKGRWGGGGETPSATAPCPSPPVGSPPGAGSGAGSGDPVWQRLTRRSTVTGWEPLALSPLSNWCSNRSRRVPASHGVSVRRWTLGGSSRRSAENCGERVRGHTPWPNFPLPVRPTSPAADRVGRGGTKSPRRAPAPRRAP